MWAEIWYRFGVPFAAVHMNDSQKHVNQENRRCCELFGNKPWLIAFKGVWKFETIADFKNPFINTLLQNNFNTNFRFFVIFFSFHTNLWNWLKFLHSKKEFNDNYQVKWLENWFFFLLVVLFSLFYIFWKYLFSVYCVSKSSWESAIPFSSNLVSFFFPIFFVLLLTTPSSSSIIFKIIISSDEPVIGATEISRTALKFPQLFRCSIDNDNCLGDDNTLHHCLLFDNYRSQVWRNSK